jgi:hypothetical protein
MSKSANKTQKSQKSWNSSHVGGGSQIKNIKTSVYEAERGLHPHPAGRNDGVVPATSQQQLSSTWGKMQGGGQIRASAPEKFQIAQF